MILTEQEASGMWCPMVRMPHTSADVEVPPVAGVNTHSSNGMGRGQMNEPPPAHCIGCKCMMWRWSDHLKPTSDGRRGFCGIAGRPGVLV